MTAHGALALTLATFIFAAIPGPGVTAVVAQALGRGLKPALLWSAGLVLGDAAYLLLALFGMGLVARELGGAFVILKWAGAAYLVYLGVRCLTAKAPAHGAACENGADSGADSRAGGNQRSLARTFASTELALSCAAMSILMSAATGTYRFSRHRRSTLARRARYSETTSVI